MAVIEIQAKTMLAHIADPDGTFGMKYNMNLYRGCQHQCIYCDSRSACYEIENFEHDVLVKVNAIDLLKKELPTKRVKGVVGTGSMNDPYMPLEKEYRLTRRAMEQLALFGFGVHVITKSNLVVRDMDLLLEIRKLHALVTFSICTTDDDLARRLEPGASAPSERFAALEALAKQGIHTGLAMMPVLPFIEDNEENITAIVKKAADCGAEYILPGFGVTLRDRQRDYYYRQLDRLFPGLRQKYERRYGERYGCNVPNDKQLGDFFYNLRKQYGIRGHAPLYQGQITPKQLSLL